MKRDILPPDEQVLGARLRREAEAARPAFSAQLHARICQAIQEADSPHPVGHRTQTAWRWTAWAAIAATVATALSLSLLGSRWRQPGAPPPGQLQATARPTSEPVSQPNGLGLLSEAANQAFQEVALLAEADPGNQLWAQLDRDAGVVAELLLDQVPIELAQNDGP